MGILHTTRPNELSNNPKTKLRVTKLYKIALAIEVNPSEMLKEICKGIKLNSIE